EGRRAVGVSFRREGRVYTARAAREVILCGGAINSPQLLLLSGIGPQEQLAALGIPVVQDLPGVGHSLQEHYSAPLKLRCRFPITVNDVLQSNLKKFKVALDYYLLRKGPLAMFSSPAALNLCRQLLTAPHLAQLTEAEFLPGPAVQSDAELLDFARRRGGTVYHPTSTCKMGVDPMAVVDPELRVRGIAGLRVADASVM